MTAKVTLRTTARGLVSVQAEGDDLGEAVEALQDALERLRDAGFRTEPTPKRRPTAMQAAART